MTHPISSPSCSGCRCRCCLLPPLCVQVWEFSAETIAILAVEVAVALMCLKRVHRGIDAVILLALYPLAMGLVAVLENAAGLN